MEDLVSMLLFYIIIIPTVLAMYKSGKINMLSLSAVFLGVIMVSSIYSALWKWQIQAQLKVLNSLLMDQASGELKTELKGTVKAFMRRLEEISHEKR